MSADCALCVCCGEVGPTWRTGVAIMDARVDELLTQTVQCTCNVSLRLTTAVRSHQQYSKSAVHDK